MALPVLETGVPVGDRPAVRMLLNWKFPVGLLGCRTSRCSIRMSVPIFMLCLPRDQEKLSMNCINDVENVALLDCVGPSCWKPTTSMTGKAFANEDDGMLGIPEAIEADEPPTMAVLSNPRRV